MPLQYQLDSVDELDDSLKSLYTEQDGKYVLAVEGLDDGKELKEALRKEREERSARQKRIDELEAEKREIAEAAETARLEAARKGGDTEALEKSWQEKLSATEKKYQEQLEALSGTVTQLTSGQTATRLASDLALPGSADVLMPHIQSRLKTDYRDGKPVTVVLDKDGKPSAMTVDELKAEFQGNPAFAPLIVGSKASGAGRQGGAESGGAVQKTVSRVDFDRMTHVERAAFSKDGGKVVDQD